MLVGNAASQVEPRRLSGPGNLHVSKQANSRFVSLTVKMKSDPEGKHLGACGGKVAPWNPVLPANVLCTEAPCLPGQARLGRAVIFHLMLG